MASTLARWLVAALPFASGIVFQAASSSAFAGDVPNGVSSAEASFLSENDKAMSTMMTNMTVRPSGDIDDDFVSMMVPHHQGAVDMARAELQYGKNEQLRRIAQEIVVEQQQEIVAMHLAIGSYPTNTAPGAASDANRTPDPVHGTTEHRAQNGMSMKMNQEPQ